LVRSALAVEQIMSRVERIGSATLHLGDCRDILYEIGKADCAITDPPYNCGKRYATHDDRMDPAAYVDWLADCFSRIRAYSLIYTPGDRHLWDGPEVTRRAGFTELQRPLGWHKKEFAGDKWSAGPAMCWEPIIWAHRGNGPNPKRVYNKIFGTAGRDFLVVPSTHGDPWTKRHPCPKPLAVMSWLVGLFCPPQGMVVDPFMGTGTVGAACALQGRGFVGIEIDPAYFDMACERIYQATRQADMFVHLPAAEANAASLFDALV
jgi:site-specific DNA-methyltransferase (adenine-specific)